MDLQLKNRVAVVMASSRGLGAGTARVFAQEGARVVMSARDQAALRATAERISAETGSETYPVAGDATKPADIAQLFDAAMTRYGRIDALVVNAGGPPGGTFMALDDAAWLAAVEGTFMNAVRAARLAIPIMTKQGGGSITLIESASIKHPIDGLILSNSLRLGVAGLVKTLAREVGPAGIRVNLICPGAFLTDRVKSLSEASAKRKGTRLEDELAERAAAAPLGRIGDPEEFGRACVFLASPAAGYITGAALVIDGGTSRAL